MCQNSRMIKRILAVAAMSLSLLALAGCSDSSQDEADADTAAAETTEAEASDGDAGSPEGTRADPFPLGTPIIEGDWTVTVNSVALAATEQILAENPFNDPPEDGQEYILVNATITYDGDDPDGSFATAMFEYVSTEGNTINTFDNLVVAPDSLDAMTTLYAGGSVTGNIAFAVPSATAGDGVIAVRAEVLSDKVYVAVR